MQAIQKSSGTIALAACGISALLLVVAGLGAIVSHQPSKPAAPQTTASTPAAAETSLAKLNTFTIEYHESGKLPAIKSLLERSRVLEYTASALEKSLQWQPIVITAKDCGDANAHFEGDRVTLCYDWLQAQIIKYQAQGITPEQAAQNTLYGSVFAVLHEIGHAAIKQFQIPYTGSQEDAADEFAVVFASSLIPSGDRAIKAGIFAYTGEATERFVNTEYRAGTQRAAFLACRLYGSKPEQYQRLAAQMEMQSDRQEQCKGIYAQSVSSWNTFLKPHRKEKS